MTEPRIQLLDELGAEFARVAADHERAPRRSRFRTSAAGPPRAFAVALGVLVLATAGAYAVPPSRAAIEDLTSSFAGWVAGDGDQAPGRPARTEDNAPAWVRAQGGRLIARTDGVPLYVTRVETEDEGTLLGFALGQSASGQEVSMSTFDTMEGWRERFDDHAVVVLGALPARSGDKARRFPLLGVTARSVDRVELHYADGPPSIADGVDGGFVLMADATRPLRELVVYDADGRELQRTDVGAFGDPAASAVP
jgi:hypothetical protein